MEELISDGPINRFMGEYAWLSNFHRAAVRLDNVEYRTVEHAYQAAKTLNKQERVRIQQAVTATEAKKLGKAVHLRKDWEEVKLEVMANLLRQKFGLSHLDLRAKLLATGDRELEEGNWWGDVYWGVDFKQGKGENWLGVLLMMVRTEIREEEE